MNKLFTLLLAITFVAATLTISAVENITSKDKVISVNLVSLTYGRVNASLEFKMEPNNSFTLTAGYWDRGSDWYAFNVGASYKWYIDAFEENKKSLNGLAVGPRLDFYYNDYNGTISNIYNPEGYPIFMVGAEASYKWVFGEGKYAIEPNFSFGFPVNKKKGEKAMQQYGFGINLGYCF